MKDTDSEAKRWYLQANDDYKFVKWVLKEAVFFDKGCFLSQQAGEKIIKACLYATGKRYVFGHSIFEMTGELVSIDKTFESINQPSKRLDRFYIPTRYPNGLPGGSPFQIYSISDLESAFEDLSAVFTCAESFLRNKGVISFKDNP